MRKILIVFQLPSHAFTPRSRCSGTQSGRQRLMDRLILLLIRLLFLVLVLVPLLVLVLGVPLILILDFFKFKCLHRKILFSQNLVNAASVGAD